MADTTPNDDEAQDSARWPSPVRAWSVAILLMLANTLAFVDRQALALLVEPIKQDLGISDTSISLLYGRLRAHLTIAKALGAASNFRPMPLLPPSMVGPTCPNVLTKRSRGWHPPLKAMMSPD